MEGGKASKSFWKQVLFINPYYFLFLLIGMLSINIYHVFSLQQAWAFSLIYFLIYALAQSTLEVLILMFIGNLIKCYLPKVLYYAFISICLVFFALHYVDFLATRFMDISVFYAIQWILSENLQNFIELLHLSGIRIMTWVFLLMFTCFFIPLLAIFIYNFTRKLIRHNPLRISQKRLVKALCCLPIGLITLDLTITPKIGQLEYYQYQRVLPWKTTLLSQGGLIIGLKGSLKDLPSEKEELNYVYSKPLTVEKKPNIYLFIVESLRDDFMTEETAPNIVGFKKENLSFGKTFSAANATQDSWYSILHSRHAFYRTEAEKRHSGSIPLQLLKKMGYQIHIYSGAQLQYYNMSNVMFGEKHYLADSYHVFPHYFPVEAWESDQKAIQAFLGDFNKEQAQEGNVFIFFIDSTHFNYSWPKDYPARFTPFSQSKTHLRVSNSIKNIDEIKNRYRNSIHFMDHLFGQVLNQIKHKGLYKEAIILFTADHGEEFFEEGQLFHLSHLSAMQTEPPLYMKLGDNERALELSPEKQIVSHVDIFPTVLDYLVGKEQFENFDGESILKENRKGYTVCCRFNGPRTAEEFFVYDGVYKGIFRFAGSKALEVRRLRDKEGRSYKLESTKIEEHFSPILNTLFNK